MELTVSANEWKNILEHLKDGEIISVVSRDADGNRKIHVYNLENERKVNKLEGEETESIDREEFLKRIKSLKEGEEITVAYK